MKNITGSLEKQDTGTLTGGSTAPNLIRRYIIVGERRLSNYWWTSVIFLGACGFLYTGISSYFGMANANGLELNQFSSSSGQTANIPFFPQGLLMSFYGSLGLLLTIYWTLLMFWNVGGGFNEFNKKEGFIRIFRWGYPGKNRKIDLMYNLKDVEAIRVELKQTDRTIYLRLKTSAEFSKNSTSRSTNGDTSAPMSKLGRPTLASAQSNSSIAALPQPTFLGIKREIPLTGISQPLTLKEIEKQASELANFLQVSLEGL